MLVGHGPTNLGRDLEAQQDVDRAVEYGLDRLLLEAEIEEGRNQGQYSSGELRKAFPVLST